MFRDRSAQDVKSRWIWNKRFGQLPTSTSFPAFLVFHCVVSKKRKVVPLFQRRYLCRVGRITQIYRRCSRMIVELHRASSEIPNDVDVSHGHARCMDTGPSSAESRTWTSWNNAGGCCTQLVRSELTVTWRTVSCRSQYGGSFECM